MRGLSPDAQRITRVLIDPHGYLFSSGQPIFPEEFPVLELDIAMFIDLAGELSRIQGPRQYLFGGCAAQHPAQDFQGAVSPVLALPMGVMVLTIVVVPPRLMSLLDLRPGARVGERMVGEPPLN